MQDTPFENIQTTALHTDAERAAMQADLMGDALADLRTAEIKKALRTLQNLRATRDREERDARRFEHEQEKKRAAQADPDAPPPFAIEIDFCQQSADAYNRAAELWADELILFMQELRGELADLLENEYGKAAFDLAHDLRNNKI